MTPTTELAVAAYAPTAVGAVALAATEAGAGLGIIVATVATGLAVPMFRWLMKREDRRQQFMEEQARTRDRLLAVQVRSLRKLLAQSRITTSALEALKASVDTLPDRMRNAG